MVDSMDLGSNPITSPEILNITVLLLLFMQNETVSNRY